MSENEKNLPPRIYHQNDPDEILILWKDLLGNSSDSFRQAIIDYDQITDPDTAPIDFVELMLAQLGSPFGDFPLTNLQKRKLVKLLIPMYNQKGLGKEKGIVKATLFLLGFEVEIVDPHAYPEDGWHVGESEIGLSTYAGGRRLYCNILNWTRTRDLLVTHSTPVSLWAAPDNTLRLTTAPLERGLHVTTKPEVTGEQMTYLRLGSDIGPVITPIKVGTLKFLWNTTEAIHSVKKYPDGSMLLVSPFQVTPNLPGYDLKFFIYTGGMIFEESGSHILWVPTDGLSSNGEGIVYLLRYSDWGTCHAFYGIRETEEN